MEALSVLDDYYNAAADLISRNLTAGRAAKTAFIDYAGTYSYAEYEGQKSGRSGMS